MAGLVLLLHPGLLPTLRLGWGVLALGILVLVVLGSLGLISWKPVGRRGLLTWCLMLAVIGLSTHFYLMIRAHANPSINEADPETLELALEGADAGPVQAARARSTRQAPVVGAVDEALAGLREGPVRAGAEAGLGGLVAAVPAGVRGGVAAGVAGREGVRQAGGDLVHHLAVPGLLPELQDGRGASAGLLLHGAVPVLRRLDRAGRGVAGGVGAGVVRGAGGAGAGGAGAGRGTVVAARGSRRRRTGGGGGAGAAAVRAAVPDGEPVLVRARPDRISGWRGTLPGTC